jgi:hypothetical protein
LRITGSAVVTTRLSSVTMKSATEVIANVQIVLLGAHLSSVFLILTYFKVEKRAGLISAALEQPSRPRLLRALEPIDAITFRSIPARRSG